MKLDDKMLAELATRLEDRRVPMLVERWRREADAGRPVPAWKMRRQVQEACRDEWRRLLGDSVKRGELRAVTAAFRQIQAGLDAALLAADPAAFPRLAGQEVRRRIARRR